MRGNVANIKTLLESAAEERRIGPFVLVEQLGRGGFAPVWLAKETYGATELRTAAVKLFSFQGEGAADDVDKRQRIVAEARALCQVEHPNVVRFYALPIDDAAQVMGVAMEHVAGTPLDARLAREGKLGVAETLDVGVAIASALSAVHRAGLVHRDVKPANVIDAGGVYKLIDFGIAAADAPGADATTGARIEMADVSADFQGKSPSTLGARPAANGVLRDVATLVIGGAWGTVGYVDPVCVATRAPATPASDLYALGALLFECVTGRVPAGAASSSTLRGEVLDGRKRPPSLVEIDQAARPALSRLVAALLEPDRKLRPASAEWIATQLEQMRTELEGVRRALPPEDTGPFRGLGRFEESDRGVYFGRASEVAATIQMLRSRGLVALIGPSGCGKSSLARAGVLPMIADGALGGWPRRWDTAVAEPGGDPRANLLEALTPFSDRPEAESPDALLAALAERAQETDFGVALLFDQLEELALVPDGLSRRFAVDFLVRAAEQPLPGVRTIVTLRRDMLEHVLVLGPLGKAIVRGSVLLEPLGDIAWGDVLDQALGSYGYRFEDDAVKADVLAQLHATSDAMPLVQFALTELWRQRDTRGKRVTRAGLEQLGGIAGALERHAEATLTGIERSRPGAVEAARVVLLSLTTALGTRAARPPEELARAAGEDGAAIVAALEASRLVVRAPGGVTLAHEALLSQWGRLRGWVAEAREDRLLADELERDAERWREAGDLVPLWRKRRLAHGEELARRNTVALSPAAEAYLVAGRRAERRARLFATIIACLVLGLATAGVGVYLRASRDALRKEQADRAAAEEQTRQVQAKQAQIDRLLRELDDSRTKEKIVALQREIRGEPSAEPKVDPAAAVTIARAHGDQRPASSAAAAASVAHPPTDASAAPVLHVQPEW